ncbi:MAG: DUF4906 domain-containing protein [Bacteroidales bacterium]|nr:DUF4906 domain-containing protein [Bacteroidales bacterium]
MIKKCGCIWLMMSLLVVSCANRVEMNSESVETPIRFEIVRSDGDVKSSLNIEDDEIKSFELYIFHNGHLVENYYRELLESHTFTLSLAAGAVYSFYAIANHGSHISFDNESDILNYSWQLGDSISDMENNGLPLCWRGEYSITGATSIAIYLERLVSKWNFAIDKNAFPDLYINSVRVAQMAATVVPFGSSPSRMTMHEGDSASAVDIAKINAGATIFFYIPENLQGILLDCDDSYDKTYDNLIAAGKETEAKNATYIELEGDFDGSGDYLGHIIYRFYLGNNTTTDFNIERNIEYNILFIPTYASAESEDIVWKVDNSGVTPAIPVIIFDVPKLISVSDTEDIPASGGSRRPLFQWSQSWTINGVEQTPVTGLVYGTIITGEHLGTNRTSRTSIGTSTANVTSNGVSATFTQDIYQQANERTSRVEYTYYDMTIDNTSFSASGGSGLITGYRSGETIYTYTSGSQTRSPKSGTYHLTEVHSDNSWITPDGTTGSFTVAENNTSNQRDGLITATYKTSTTEITRTFQIYQSGTESIYRYTLTAAPSTITTALGSSTLKVMEQRYTNGEADGPAVDVTDSAIFTSGDTNHITISGKTAKATSAATGHSGSVIITANGSYQGRTIEAICSLEYDIPAPEEITYEFIPNVNGIITNSNSPKISIRLIKRRNGYIIENMDAFSYITNWNSPYINVDNAGYCTAKESIFRLDNSGYFIYDGGNYTGTENVTATLSVDGKTFTQTIAVGYNMEPTGLEVNGGRISLGIGTNQFRTIVVFGNTVRRNLVINPIATTMHFTPRTSMEFTLFEESDEISISDMGSGTASLQVTAFDLNSVTYVIR